MSSTGNHKIKIRKKLIQKSGCAVNPDGVKFHEGSPDIIRRLWHKGFAEHRIGFVDSLVDYLVC